MNKARKEVMGVYFKKKEDKYDKYYDAFFRDNVTAMLLIDPVTYQIIDVNFAACRMYECSTQEILELNFSDLKALKSNVRIHTGPITIEDENLIHAVIFDNSSGDAAVREMELLQEIIEMKDNFLTMITHEFKTPITIINAALQTMELKCGNEISDRMRSYLNKIRQSSLRQQRLIDNLLDITILKAGRMKSEFKNVDISSLTKEIVESVRVYSDQKHLRLSFYSACSDVVVSTDIEKYERILLNLLSNAIKYTPAGRSIQVVLYLKGSCLVAEIKDKGIGIPEDKNELIFERFGQADTTLTRQAEGAGIGLYLTKLLVESIGGTIHVTSLVNYGSIFSVTIPLRHEASRDFGEISVGRILQATALEFSDIIL